MGQRLTTNKRSAGHSQSMEEGSYTSQALAALSTPFPDAIAELILDLSTGYLSINSEEVYSAEKVYRCSFEGSPIIEPTPTPYSIPRLMRDLSLLKQLKCAEMTLSFRFKAFRALFSADSNGAFFAINFFCASDIANGRLARRNIKIRYGKKLQELKLIDGEWHVALLRISKARGIFQIMIDDARTAEQLPFEDFMDTTAPVISDFTPENLAQHFGGHICRVSAEARMGMDGETADIRVYDWVLDERQCQGLMDNYTTPYRKRKDADGNAHNESPRTAYVPPTTKVVSTSTVSSCDPDSDQFDDCFDSEDEFELCAGSAMQYDADVDEIYETEHFADEEMPKHVGFGSVGATLDLIAAAVRLRQSKTCSTESNSNTTNPRSASSAHKWVSI